MLLEAITVPKFGSFPMVGLLRIQVEQPTFACCGVFKHVDSFSTVELANERIMQTYHSYINKGEKGILVVYQYTELRVTTHFYRA
jgi:hypothetical protein